MANSNGSVNLVNLDFDTLKSSFKSYLSSQTAFRDYNLEGSNLSVLLDVMAYNTYINSFYLNMVASEMYLDTAQLRASVISHAKELNYTPRSFRSAKAIVNLAIAPTNPTGITTVTVPRGTSFTSKVGSNTYTFTVPDNLLITGSIDGVFYASNVALYEGSLITDTFVYNSSNEGQRFILSNPTVDTTSLRVYVTENNGSSVLQYQQATSYLGMTASTQGFFVQAAENDLYEILFGNGEQGRMPSHGAIISVVYQVGNGELPNGCSIFSSDDAIDGHTNVRVTTVQDAMGGAVHETTQMIRRNAPRFYQTQERAVTATDYQTLLQLAYPEISAIYVYGGEEAQPPRYGKVLVSVDIDNADGVSDSKKEEYRKFLKTRCPLTIDPIFIDPEFLNVEVYSNVSYNINTTPVSESELISAIKTKVRVFNEQTLNDFNAVCRYSKLVNEIDATSEHVISNSTDLMVYKELNPTLNSTEPFTVSFYNKLKSTQSSSTLHSYTDSHTVSSTYFTYQGNTCKIEDDGYGVIRIVALTYGTTGHTTIVNIGTVDYDTGTIVFEGGLPISAYEGPYIRLRVVTDSKDIDASQNNIIRIKDDDIYINVTGERA